MNGPPGGMLAGSARHIGAQAVAATLRLPLWVEAEVDQRIVRERAGHQDVAAVAAVSAGGASARDKLLAPEGHAAVATVAGLDPYPRFVDKHLCSNRQFTGARRGRSL